MKYQSLIALSGIVSYVQGNVFDFRSSVPATRGVVPLSFERKFVSGRRMRRRSDSVGETAQTATGSASFSYQVNATVGTPPQAIGLSLDTGSSDIILLHGNEAFCSNNKVFCVGVDASTYNANKSSTYTYMNSNFTADFGFAAQGEGSSAMGDVATDVFTIGGVSIKDQQFAIAYGDPSIDFSILGLSYASGENQVNNEGKPPYDNLPLSMAASGATNLALFTLWQDEVSQNTGHLLFGGIDQDTYTGDIVTLPVQVRENFTVPVAFDVIMNGFATTAPNGSVLHNSTGSELTVIDCGTGFSIIQDKWAQPILDEFNITYIESNDTSIIDCSFLDQKSTIDFTFGSVTVKSPIQNFISLLENNFCIFGIVPAGSREALIGVNFLNAAVVAFDLTNNEISIAQRDFGSSGGDVVAVPNGGISKLGESSGSGGASSSGSATASGTASGTSSSATATTSKKSGASSVSAGWYAFTALGMTSCLFISL